MVDPLVEILVVYSQADKCCHSLGIYLGVLCLGKTHLKQSLNCVTEPPSLLRIRDFRSIIRGDLYP